MPQLPSKRALLAGLFLLIAVFIAYRGGVPLTAQVFDGAGLVGGLGEARNELDQSGIRDDVDFVQAIASVINFILLFAGIFAFVAFVVAGFIFILGFGADQANQRAKKIMIWAAVGLVVIIFSFTLTQFIVDFTTAN